MRCPKCNNDLIEIYNKELGWFNHYESPKGWEYHVFFVGHCDKCNTDWKWKDIDYMREWWATDLAPAFKTNGEWVYT